MKMFIKKEKQKKKKTLAGLEKNPNPLIISI
jgi:hypothetical protein